MNERWFDGDGSEYYFGMGHVDRDEFALWIVEHEVEHGATLAEAATWVDPTRVVHEWVRWIGDEPYERFERCESHAMGAFAITRHRGRGGDR